MIFNGEMTRAILDGRKTQTRRIMKAQPSEDFTPMNMALDADYKARWYTPGIVDKDGCLQPAGKEVFGVANENEGYSCPFGAVGDRIWVREAYRFPASLDDVSPTGVGEMAVATGYRKPWAPTFYEFTGTFSNGWKGFETPPKVSDAGKLRPSIHMPRWASRILLEITDVRVERLNAISQEDAQAEGMELTGWRPTYSDPDSGGEVMTPYDNFAELWSSIYGDESWKANPWVWVISFKRVEGGAA
ncbi:TPA: hypothetical protein P1K67_001907 [Klebsiella pneumoniae]|nr:hypothetical protein [Klebsiella pneumoniae]HDN2687328.1 hypothetical protein [Klebsiella pneumoniae]HDN2693203.1 hypothetical protein [Klebsiella pneumoniae]